MKFPTISHPIHFIATILVIVGALAWFSIGAFNKNFVHELAGDKDKYIYILVGIAGIYLAITKGLWLSGVNMMKVEV